MEGHSPVKPPPPPDAGKSAQPPHVAEMKARTERDQALTGLLYGLSELVQVGVRALEALLDEAERAAVREMERDARRQAR